MADLVERDLNEYEKLLRCVMVKVVQIIVQSRQGEKTRTNCKLVSSGTDWFNLAVPDIQPLLAETKRIIGGGVPVSELCLYVEISLKTIDGDSMVLEIWSLKHSPRLTSDQYARKPHSVHYRIGMMLKSLLCVTRAVPAYQLSRRQSSESYIICYRQSVGVPPTDCLGEQSVIKQVGNVPSGRGTLHLNLAYRTQMTLPGNTVKQDVEYPTMIKHDHFQAEHSLGQPTPRPCHAQAERRYSGAGVDITAGVQEPLVDEMYSDMFSTSPCAGCMANCSSTHVDSKQPNEVPQCTGQGDLDDVFGQPAKHGAFASRTTQNMESQLGDIPFAALLQQSQLVCNSAYKTKTSATTAPDTDKNSNVTEQAPSISGPEQQAHISGGVEDDFLLVDLTPPFAKTDPSNDLAAFYLDCQTAPLLQTFTTVTPDVEEVENLTNQIQAFEVNSEMFDDFVNNLQQVER